MAQHLDDWKDLQEQIEKLKGHELGPVPALDEVLDAGIRRRFGRVIARTNHKPSIRETLAVARVVRWTGRP